MSGTNDDTQTGTGGLTLRGIDGTNPLGFLAALGTLVVARAGGESRALLRWTRGRTWIPVVEGLAVADEEAFCDLLTDALRGKQVPPDAKQKRLDADKAFKEAKTAIKRKRKDIKERRLSRDERRAAIEAEVAPLEAECDAKRAVWLAALRDAVPRPELALGSRIDCSDAEYREHAEAMLASADVRDRESVDFLAAFASDACLLHEAEVEPTPFCFIKGSGQQFFLDTVRQLMEHVSPERVRRTLFEPWTYPDEKLSMRWDPVEDRRYALMDRDPTAGDNKSRTMWIANLLGYRALALFSCVPTRRGLGTTGWSSASGELAFTWPIWGSAADADTIRSLLQLRMLYSDSPDARELRARGVMTVLRSRRIRVPPTGSNFKLNFSPARPL